MFIIISLSSIRIIHNPSYYVSNTWDIVLSFLSFKSKYKRLCPMWIPCYQQLAFYKLFTNPLLSWTTLLWELSLGRLDIQIWPVPFSYLPFSYRGWRLQALGTCKVFCYAVYSNTISLCLKGLLLQEIIVKYNSDKRLYIFFSLTKGHLIALHYMIFILIQM